MLLRGLLSPFCALLPICPSLSLCLFCYVFHFAPIYLGVSRGPIAARFVLFPLTCRAPRRRCSNGCLFLQREEAAKHLEHEVSVLSDRLDALQRQQKQQQQHHEQRMEGLQKELVGRPVAAAAVGLLLC